MNCLLKLVLVGILYGLPNVGFSQETDWRGFQKDSIVASLDGVVQRFYYFRSTELINRPLVVYLHQWSADYASFKNSLAPQVSAKNWNYIHPDFRGPNNHVKACGSNYVIEDIDEAIDWAIKNLAVDTTSIYVVGASGGGYTALCSFMKSRHKIKEYAVWVPITDLRQWYFESKSRNSKYAVDIKNCTCHDCREIDLEEADRRSPIHWKTPASKLAKSKLKIYAGIHDGFTGAVPISHSIYFFNKVVADSGGEIKDQVSGEETRWMLTKQTVQNKVNGRIGERNILYFKEFNNISLTIFEGGHEILVDEVLPLLSGVNMR